MIFFIKKILILFKKKDIFLNSEVNRTFTLTMIKLKDMTFSLINGLT
jgi:hypothetical protein